MGVDFLFPLSSHSSFANMPSVNYMNNGSAPFWDFLALSSKITVILRLLRTTTASASPKMPSVVRATGL